LSFDQLDECLKNFEMQRSYDVERKNDLYGNVTKRYFKDIYFDKRRCATGREGGPRREWYEPGSQPRTFSAIIQVNGDTKRSVHASLTRALLWLDMVRRLMVGPRCSDRLIAKINYRGEKIRCPCLYEFPLRYLDCVHYVHTQCDDLAYDPHRYNYICTNGPLTTPSSLLSLSHLFIQLQFSSQQNQHNQVQEDNTNVDSDGHDVNTQSIQSNDDIAQEDNQNTFPDIPMDGDRSQDNVNYDNANLILGSIDHENSQDTDNDTSNCSSVGVGHVSPRSYTDDSTATDTLWGMLMDGDRSEDNPDDDFFCGDKYQNEEMT